jgi:hypothetical protein
MSLLELKSNYFNFPIPVSITIASALKANGNARTRDRVPNVRNMMVRNPPIHIEQHQTQLRTPAKKVSGTRYACPPSSCFIPANSRNFTNIFIGPASFTKSEAIRHVANPRIIKFVMVMDEFYIKIRINVTTVLDVYRIEF